MVVYNTRRKRRSVIQILSVLRIVIIDYECEVFQWDNAEGSEAEEISR